MQTLHRRQWSALKQRDAFFFIKVALQNNDFPFLLLGFKSHPRSIKCKPDFYICHMNVGPSKDRKIRVQNKTKLYLHSFLFLSGLLLIAIRGRRIVGTNLSQNCLQSNFPTSVCGRLWKNKMSERKNERNNQICETTKFSFHNLPVSQFVKGKDVRQLHNQRSESSVSQDAKWPTTTTTWTDRLK